MDEGKSYDGLYDISKIVGKRNDDGSFLRVGRANFIYPSEDEGPGSSL